MKKIYLSLFALLAWMGGTSVFAQKSDFEMKSVSVGACVAEFEPETWYFLYQGRPSGGGWGDYDLPAVGDEAPSGGGFMTDCGVGNDLLKKSADDVGPGSSASAVAAYMVRFLPTSDGAYNIQFGTGNYLTAPNGSGNSRTITTAASIYDAGKYNIYNIDPNDEGDPEGYHGPGYFALNVFDMKELIDNNGTGNTIVTWDSGQKTVITGNSVWSIFEATFEAIGESEAAYNLLIDTYSKYFDYIGTFPTGELPGEYSAEAVQAFEDAINAINVDDNPEILEGLTYSAAQALAQVVADAYQKVLDSKVAFTLADGYYRLRSGMLYTNTFYEVDPETGDTISEEERDLYKYMYTTRDASGTWYGVWGSPKEPANYCPALWRVTKKDDAYDIVNMATGMRFDNVKTSSNVTLSAESENLMAIEHVAYLQDFDEAEGVNIVNIRVASQATNSSFYLHQGGHGGGAGRSGYLVGWYTTYEEGSPKASEWVFEAVSDEEAQAVIDGYADTREQLALLQNYRDLYAEAADAIKAAQDVQHIPLITSVDQITSPWTEPSEGSIPALLDGDTSSFWHSNWSDGSVEGHVHYLQVELAEPIHELMSVEFTRRPVSNDHVTVMSVYGSNDPYADDDSWTELLVFDTPFKNNTETIVSAPFDVQGMQYIRLYADATTNNRGYWHMSELQFYVDRENPNSQYSTMGEVAVNLDNLLQAQAGLSDEEVTQAVYDDLVAAYNAFKGAFVDPAELRAVLARLQDKPASVVVGTQPGFWKDASTAEALTKTIADAKAYDEAGKYTAAMSNAFIEQLNAEAKAIDDAVIPVTTGKWYRIRFANEDEFDEYGWDPVAGDAQGDHEALFGKYVTVAAFEGGVVEPISAGDVLLGNQIYLDDESDIDDADMALFRLVAVGDSTFLLQNKGTGLFIKAAGTSGATTLSVHPSFFNPRAIGYGLNVFAAKSLTGEPQSYLHAQVANNTLVTWDVDYPGSRSGFYVEEVEDVAENYDGTAFNMGVRVGEVNTFCYPMDLAAEEGQMYTVTSVEEQKVTLIPIVHAAAGRPFIYINGDTDKFEAEDEAEPASFHHSYSVVTEPQTGGLLKGTFASTLVGAGAIVAEGNALVVSKRSNTTVGANSAYISEEEPYDLEAEISVIIDAEGQDGIQAALANVSRSGDIFTIDGRRVGKGNLNSLKNLGRGIYILNGTKVTVK